VPSQQPQGQLQTQHSADTGSYIKDKHNMNTTAIYTSNNSIQFLFICMLTQQPKGQLQSKHEWKKQTHTKYKDKAIYNIWVMMTVIKIIIITEIKVIN
jgi:hypothetical protein